MNDVDADDAFGENGYQWVMDYDDGGVAPLRIPLTGLPCACDGCPAMRPFEKLESCH